MLCTRVKYPYTLTLYTHTHMMEKNGAKENPIKMNTKTKYTHLTLDVSFVAVCCVRIWIFFSFSCVFDLKFISFGQNLLCNGCAKKRNKQITQNEEEGR